jgi:hypothetical protein
MTPQYNDPKGAAGALKTPSRFILSLSTRSPFSEWPSKGELDDFDQSKSYYHCAIHHEGKAIAVESPIFSKDDEQERFRAYSILRECIMDCITRKLLPESDCPQYEIIDGVVKPCNINYGKQTKNEYTK